MVSLSDIEQFTTWTLGALKTRRLAVEGYCEMEGCREFYVFDLDNLIENLGTDYLVPKIVPGVTCKTCGGRVKFRLAMMAPEQ